MPGFDRTTLVRFTLRALSWLPLPLLHALGWLFGSLLAVLPTEVRHNARINIELCFPELDPPARRRLIRQTLREMGKSFAELAAFWHWSPQRLERLVKRAQGEELLLDAAAQGTGALVAAPHLGAWELLALRFARRVPLHSLYRPPRLAQFDPLLRAARQRHGGQIHPANGHGIRMLYKAITRGEVAAILPDQEPRGEGVFAPFFGVEAKTMTLLPKLANRSRAPVLFGYAIRLPWGRGYEVRFQPAPDAIYDDDPLVAATAMNAAIEECVRQALPQYQWTYRRFRQRPDGSGNPYNVGRAKRKRRRRRRQREK